MANEHVPPKVPAKKKVIKISQTDFPRVSLEKALEIARVLWEQFGGAPTEPHQIAIALKSSPASSSWRILTGSSIAYSLTDGGYNSKNIVLTSLGKSVVAPTADGETEEALVSAILKPRIMKLFFERFDNKKLPFSDIGSNILNTLGLPKDRSIEAFKVIEENGRSTGVIQETVTGLFVSLSSATKIQRERKSSYEEGGAISQKGEIDIGLEEIARRVSEEPIAKELKSLLIEKNNNRVFISHGKN
jgi:hypothetical protein